MTSLLSSLNPINSFPPYHGPHAVGTVDVELPVASLPAPSLDLPVASLPAPSLDLPVASPPAPSLDLPDASLPAPSLDLPDASLPAPSLDLPVASPPAPSLDLPDASLPAPSLDLPPAPSLDLPPAPSLDLPPDAPATVAFRIFYPCEPQSSSPRPVHWFARPQRPTAAALYRYFGFCPRAATAFAHCTPHLYWIRLRAHRNAPLLAPPSTPPADHPHTPPARWPVIVFSHGLAGGRNMYSYICGDLASHGCVVVALDHRDGSSPVQHVRATDAAAPRTIEPRTISHDPCAASWHARDAQLRIRLWEVSVALEALVQIDTRGDAVPNLDDNVGGRSGERVEVLARFVDRLDVHRPGAVSWAGHSFGAATMAQLAKTVFYRSDASAVARPLLRPRHDAAISHQITPASPLLLLDLWAFPLQSPDQAWLWRRPLPTYAPSGPHGPNIAAIMSEAFYKWPHNRALHLQLLAASAKNPSPRPASPSPDSGYVSSASQSPHPAGPAPHIFYIARSQHFSQSDVAVLFPLLVQRVTTAEEPALVMELNVRVLLAVLRRAGVRLEGREDAELLSRRGGTRKLVPVEDAGEGL